MPRGQVPPSHLIHALTHQDHKHAGAITPWPQPEGKEVPHNLSQALASTRGASARGYF